MTYRELIRRLRSRTTGTASLQSGDSDCARPDLRPPEPDELLDLGATALRYFRDWRIGKEMQAVAMSRAISRSARALSSKVAIPMAARPLSKARPIARAASIEPVGWKPVANAVHRDGRILPGELAGQCVDLGLTFRRDCGEMRAIPLEEGTRIRRPATPISGAFWLQLRNQRCHPPRDLAVDQVELALNLPPRLLHAMKERQTIRGWAHVTLPVCQPTKSDGPA